MCHIILNVKLSRVQFMFMLMQSASSVSQNYIQVGRIFSDNLMSFSTHSSYNLSCLFSV